MDSTDFLKLAEFFVSISDKNEDISLCAWRHEGLFKFHLTNNYKPGNSFISHNRDCNIFSTPYQPKTSPERSGAIDNLHHCSTVVPNIVGVKDKQDELPEDCRPVEEKDDDVDDEVDDDEDDNEDDNVDDEDDNNFKDEQEPLQPPESSNICDHDPLSNPGLNHNGFPKKGVFEKGAVFSPCDHSQLGSRKADCKYVYSCPLCNHLINEAKLQYICRTHKNHWHERLDSCERKIRVSNNLYF